MLQLPAISIVGSRLASPYGKQAAKVFAHNIAAYGVTIVSGLAKGIDGVAHLAALEQPGKTIAVMATGFDRIYPSEHKMLAKQIEQVGLVLTETPLFRHTHAGYFPRRNRIIAGIGMSTLVVEAAMKSGSLITARFAAETGKPVCVVPGPLFSKENEGSNQLLMDGATPVLSVQDVFRACGLELNQANDFVNEQNMDYSEESDFICDLLQNKAMTMEEIFVHCKFSLGHLHRVLLSLQMRKVVEVVPGSHFISLKGI
jgi:DNA processing protein